jgi:hypothetical protein
VYNTSELFKASFASLHRLGASFDQTHLIFSGYSYFDTMILLRTSILFTVLLPLSVLAQNIPWTFQYGPRSNSGQGNERCHQDLLRQNEQFSFQTWGALPPPNNAPSQSSQGSSCNPHATSSKEWERRDEQCVRERDKKRKDQCYDHLEKDKKSEKLRVDDCQKKRERACGAISDTKTRENCFTQLDSERRGGPPVQQPAPPKPQTKCCLKLYSDNNCKVKVFEACSPGSGTAKGDAPSWNVNCA